MDKRLLLLLFFPLSLFADYGWIPRYQNLIFKGGMDYYSTSDNFSDNGDIVAVTYLSTPMKLTRFNFWLDPEYSFARDWSASLRLGFYTQNLTAESGAAVGNTVLSGSGLEDFRLSTKWRLMKKPVLTLETMARIPIASSSPQDANSLIGGDGIFDVGMLLHAGMIARPMYFSLSPGFRLRPGGYASQFLLQSAVGVMFRKGYVRLFTDLAISPGDLDASTTQNTALGSGGTFALHALSSSNFSIGFKTGLNFLDTYKLEVAVSKAVWGSRAPNYFLFTVGIAKTIDFYEPEMKIKVEEVPFDTEVVDPNN